MTLKWHRWFRKKRVLLTLLTNLILRNTVNYRWFLVLLTSRVPFFWWFLWLNRRFFLNLRHEKAHIAVLVPAWVPLWFTSHSLQRWALTDKNEALCSSLASRKPEKFSSFAKESSGNRSRWDWLWKEWRQTWQLHASVELAYHLIPLGFLRAFDLKMEYTVPRFIIFNP